ncbi:MAG: hypothetical protein CV089_16545 [Nitrospira sp. WS110]|nr:hypothetical protein [Nitrospira sp. WS110]
MIDWEKPSSILGASPVDRLARTIYLAPTHLSIVTSVDRRTGRVQDELCEEFGTNRGDAGGHLQTLWRVDGAMFHEFVAPRSGGGGPGSIVALRKLWRVAG